MDTDIRKHSFVKIKKEMSISTRFEPRTTAFGSHHLLPLGHLANVHLVRLTISF